MTPCDGIVRAPKGDFPCQGINGHLGANRGVHWAGLIKVLGTREVPAQYPGAPHRIMLRLACGHETGPRSRNSKIPSRCKCPVCNPSLEASVSEPTEPTTTEPEAPTAEVVKREPTEISPFPPPTEDLVVLARNPEEMVSAQQSLIAWFEQKLDIEKAQLAECEENLANAKKLKVRTAGWARQVALARGRVNYYDKGLAALQEGYAIVPDFPVQVIAVKVKDKVPTRRSYIGHGVPDVEAVTKLKQGEGHYVDPYPETRTTSYETSEGRTRYSTEPTFYREVDFPFKLVRPQILSDLGVAMKRRIFDEIGVLPGRTRNPDPILVGRILRKDGPHTKVLSFLITWWIDTRTL